MEAGGCGVSLAPALTPVEGDYSFAHELVTIRVQPTVDVFAPAQAISSRFVICMSVKTRTKITEPSNVA